MIYIEGKKSTGKLCYGLSLAEYRCKCNNKQCRLTLVAPELLEAYEKFRRKVDVKLTIVSGFRCTIKNFKNGVPKSKHCAGQAIDILLEQLKHFSKAEIRAMAKEAGFNYIKFYPTFIHCDVRMARPKP